MKLKTYYPSREGYTCHRAYYRSYLKINQLLSSLAQKPSDMAVSISPQAGIAPNTKISKVQGAELDTTLGLTWEIKPGTADNSHFLVYLSNSLNIGILNL